MLARVLCTIKPPAFRRRCVLITFSPIFAKTVSISNEDARLRILRLDYVVHRAAQARVVDTYPRPLRGVGVLSGPLFGTRF